MRRCANDFVNSAFPLTFCSMTDGNPIYRMDFIFLIPKRANNRVKLDGKEQDSGSASLCALLLTLLNRLYQYCPKPHMTC